MKLFWIFLLILIFVCGCTTTPTGNIIIEDVPDVVEEVKTKEPEEPQPEVVEEKAEEKIEENEEITDAGEEIVVEQEEKVKVIQIKDMKFIPEELTISAGTRVIWKHNDRNDVRDIVHVIRIYPLGVKSDRLHYGDEFEYTFTEPKKYWYIDIIYKESMKKGVIIVE